MKKDRREFIRQAAALGCGMALAPLLLQGCKSVQYVKPEQTEDGLVVAASELEEHGFVVLESETLQAPVYLTRHEGKLIALEMLCTHKACTLRASRTVLSCDCHGSEFNRKGEVLQGPAREPLRTFEVEESQGKLIIRG